MQNPQQTLGQFQPTSALQEQLGQTFSQLLTGQGNQLQSAQRAIAAQQELLPDIMSTIKEQAPSRWNTAVLGEQRRALDQFNALTMDTLFRGSLADQQGMLQALGMGSQFALGQSGQQNAFIQQLLGQIGGAATGVPVITQNPGFMQNLAQLLGSAGGTAASMQGAGMFGGASA
jgi:hypothetical protein